MRLWYVIDTSEYWLEPEFKVGKTGRITVTGCKLFDKDSNYKGYWHFRDWPVAVRKTVRERIDAELSRRRMYNRIERARMRSYLGKNK